MECTRRVPFKRQVAEQVRESQPQPSDETVGSKGKERSEAQKARREAKKRRRLARRSEASSCLQVYRRKPSSEFPSTSARPPSLSLDPLQEQASTSTPGDSSSYEEMFPTLVESCNVLPNKEPRRSGRIKCKK